MMSSLLVVPRIHGSLSRVYPQLRKLRCDQQTASSKSVRRQTNNSSGKRPVKTSASTDSKQTTKSVVPQAFGIGIFAGICGSLAGMGGGFVMIPLMTSSRLGIKLSQHQAHGTSLFAVTTTGIAGSLGYSGQVDYPAAAAIALSGMVTARFGAQATTKLSEEKLRKALGVFMLCVAPLVPFKSYFLHNNSTGEFENTEMNHTNQQSSSTSSTTPINKLYIPFSIGCCSGFLAGLFGVGGGAIVVPALTIATDMNHYQALGTSLCAMSLPAMVGTVTHYSKGNVAMRVAPFLATGAFVGGYLGGRLGLNIPEDKLKYGFSGLMVVLGIRTLLK